MSVLPRTASLVPLLVAAAGCGSSPPSQTPVLANRSAAPSAAVPTGLAFAALETTADRGCALVRVHLGGTAEVLASVPNPCAGGRIAFAPDVKHAVIWFDPQLVEDPPDGGGPGSLYEVDLGARTVHALPDPGFRDPIEHVAYGEDGALYAFATHDFPNATGAVTYLGHALDFSQIADGMPAAAVVDRRGLTGAWELAEVAVTTTGWDYAQGYSAATHAQHLAPESREYLEAFSETHPVEPRWVAALAPLAPPTDGTEDGFQRLPTGPGAYVYAWMVTAELTYTSGLLAWIDHDRAVRLPDSHGDHSTFASVHVLADHRYLVVAGSRTGTFPRVYELATHRLAYASDRAAAFMPWPVTRS